MSLPLPFTEQQRGYLSPWEARKNSYLWRRQNKRSYQNRIKSPVTGIQTRVSHTNNPSIAWQTEERQGQWDRLKRLHLAGRQGIFRHGAPTSKGRNPDFEVSHSRHLGREHWANLLMGSPRRERDRQVNRGGALQGKETDFDLFPLQHPPSATETADVEPPQPGPPKMLQGRVTQGLWAYPAWHKLEAFCTPWL